MCRIEIQINKWESNEEKKYIWSRLGSYMVLSPYYEYTPVSVPRKCTIRF